MRRKFSSLIECSSITPAIMAAFIVVGLMSFKFDLSILWAMIPLAFPAAVTFTYFMSSTDRFMSPVNCSSPASEWLTPIFMFVLFIPLYFVASALLALPVRLGIEEFIYLNKDEGFHLAQFLAIIVGFMPLAYYRLKLKG